MCGIVGFSATRDVTEMLLAGLERLEYRGYDSAGIAVMQAGKLEVRKSKGRIAQLRALVDAQPVQGSIGIGHTRWATHGEPSDVNAHPHTDKKGDIAIIHNGIIENYMRLKRYLIEQGCEFVSETDTEVIAHLLNYHYNGDMRATLYKVLPLLEGSFALGVICEQEPDVIYCTRRDSPLVIGSLEGGGEQQGTFLSSDISTVLRWSRNVCLLEDMDVAVLHAGGYSVFDALGKPVERRNIHIDWDVPLAEKAGYAHFMLKEIHDEPKALHDTYRAFTAAQSIPEAAVQRMSRLHIIACGTAYHAGLVGRYALERLAGIPTEVEIASEFRYRQPILEPGTVGIVISQSGETADTLAALRLMKQRGHTVYAICNVVGSSIAREADRVFYTWAGPEIAVASTKAYVCQLMMLYALAIDLGTKLRTLAPDRAAYLSAQLTYMPELVQPQLALKADIQRFAHAHADRHSVFYMGRGLDWALAQEGSLKLKEISYIHSEAYAAGELKHGTIALIEPGTLVVGLLTQTGLLPKTLGNLQEVRVRGAHMLTIGRAGVNGELASAYDAHINIPDVDDIFTPIVAIVPMQLFAYYMALEKGCDIDKPRNLAKSVTVE